MKTPIRTLCIMGLMTALCMVLGYLERLVSLDFIAPGIRLGLANSLALVLIDRKKPFYALGINLARILLSALLFGSIVSLAFSLAGGIAAWGIMLLLSRFKSVSIIGMSIAGGAVHNLLQLTVAILLLGKAVIFYAPVLLTAGAVSGALIGYLALFLAKKSRNIIIIN